ncbi:Alpha-L-rhamnosidase, partial [Phytophthora palmivora]
MSVYMRCKLCHFDIKIGADISEDRIHERVWVMYLKSCRYCIDSVREKILGMLGDGAFYITVFASLAPEPEESLSMRPPLSVLGAFLVGEIMVRRNSATVYTVANSMGTIDNDLFNGNMSFKDIVNVMCLEHNFCQLY